MMQALIVDQLLSIKYYYFNFTESPDTRPFLCLEMLMNDRKISNFRNELRFSSDLKLSLL